mgnify:CR=1 FL=1
MDAFVNVLMTILFCGTPIFLWIQNVKQDDEIKKLNDKIKQFEAEKESLMENMRTLCEQRDSIKKEIHDVFNKN